MHLLDSSSAVWPTVSNTWFLALVRSLYAKVFGPPEKDIDASSKRIDVEAEDTESSSTESDTLRTSVPKGNRTTARAPALKAGGKRRKTTRKR